MCKNSDKTMKTSFLKEWNNSQFKTAEKAICKYIVSRFFETSHSNGADPFAGFGKDFSYISKVLGLACTSTSAYAGLWACNTELYLDVNKKFKLDGFAMDRHSFVYAIWSDKNENELITPIN